MWRPEFTQNFFVFLTGDLADKKLQKLFINVCCNKTAGSIGTPFALKLKMDNILNNLIQFNIKARVNMLRYLFVFSKQPIVCPSKKTPKKKRNKNFQKRVYLLP